MCSAYLSSLRAHTRHLLFPVQLPAPERPANSLNMFRLDSHRERCVVRGWWLCCRGNIHKLLMSRSTGSKNPKDCFVFGSGGAGISWALLFISISLQRRTLITPFLLVTCGWDGLHRLQPKKLLEHKQRSVWHIQGMRSTYNHLFRLWRTL